MKYAAFIRGVGPGNPNMHQEPLKKFFEELGFENVSVVISSGNIIFETEKPQSILEAFIEENLPKKLGFSRAVIIRDHDQLKKIFKSDPFKGSIDTPTNKLNVSFIKKGGEVFNIINPTDKKTPQVMRNLEKEYGKDITMRTWGTLTKILKKMENTS